MSDKPTITFTLVHGTFARSADWIHDSQDTKKFRKKIEAELGEDYNVHFEVIGWGFNQVWRKLCDNTISQRLFGTKELKKYLFNSSDVTSANQRYIVAHSHAGNIAMYAMRDSKIHSKVSGVITLSTPFLIYKRALLTPGLLGLSGLVLLLYAVDSDATALHIYAAVYTVLVLIMLITGKFGGTKEKDAEVNKAIDEKIAELKLAQPNHFPGVSGQPAFLAIRPHRDEVTIVFWVIKVLSSAFRWLWQIVNRIGEWLVSGYLILIVLRAGIERFPSTIDITSLQGFMSDADKLVLTPMLIGISAVLFLLAVSRLFYAFDSTPWIVSLDVKPEIVPWPGAEKKVLQTWGLVKHTNIQNQSPAIIADWIRNKEDG